jgi:hypothetical protein
LQAVRNSGVKPMTTSDAVPDRFMSFPGFPRWERF